VLVSVREFGFSDTRGVPELQALSLYPGLQRLVDRGRVDFVPSKSIKLHSKANLDAKGVTDSRVGIVDVACWVRLWKFSLERSGLLLNGGISGTHDFRRPALSFSHEPPL
jgi:hypothetical protein